MIAGQAPERWDSPESTVVWHIGEARTEEGRERVLRGAQAWATREREPITRAMRHGNRKGTPFWTFSQRAAEQLEPDADGPWLSRYAWWNLHPIGWQDRHGTPTGGLHAAQTPYVAELFWGLPRSSRSSACFWSRARTGGRTSASCSGSTGSRRGPCR